MNEKLLKDIEIVENYILNKYERSLNEAMGQLSNPFITPSASYRNHMKSPRRKRRIFPFIPRDVF